MFSQIKRSADWTITYLQSVLKTEKEKKNEIIKPHAQNNTTCPDYFGFASHDTQADTLAAKRVVFLPTNRQQYNKIFIYLPKYDKSKYKRWKTSLVRE